MLAIASEERIVVIVCGDPAAAHRAGSSGGVDAVVLATALILRGVCSPSLLLPTATVPIDALEELCARHAVTKRFHDVGRRGGKFSGQRPLHQQWYWQRLV